MHLSVCQVCFCFALDLAVFTPKLLLFASPLNISFFSSSAHCERSCKAYAQCEHAVLSFLLMSALITEVHDGISAVFDVCVCVCVYMYIYISQKDQRKNFLCEWTERIAYRQTLDYLLKNSEADNLAERSRACAMLEILLSWASMHLGGLS